jgi:hypothetical protein
MDLTESFFKIVPEIHFDEFAATASSHSESTVSSITCSTGPQKKSYSQEVMKILPNLRDSVKSATRLDWQNLCFFVSSAY